MEQQKIKATIKHPQSILALDKEYTDGALGLGLQHGVYRIPSLEWINMWFKDASNYAFIGQRDALEYNPKFRQVLPYTPVVFVDINATELDIANAPIFLYQRTKQIGESRLAGNYSIGIGGHIDALDCCYDADSVLDMQVTIEKNIEREVLTEELVFTKDGEEINPLLNTEYFRRSSYGLIRDDSNNVGKVHLGVVTLLLVDKSVQIKCREDELVTHEPMTAAQMKTSGFNFEGWSQILIDSMTQSELSVAPTPARPAGYDTLTQQHYITAREGDKLTELAVEFDLTLASLLRLNPHLVTSANIVGMRVNVPDMENQI